MPSSPGHWSLRHHRQSPAAHRLALRGWQVAAPRYQSAIGGDAEADVQLDHVGSLPNAALVISRLHRGEKRPVFCDSRARVEELVVELCNPGVETFVSHSSLSHHERRRAEAAFAEATYCVIVATSTLELGIDVGDLDRVIQIDAPYRVSSFLQRLGRSGRRVSWNRNVGRQRCTSVRIIAVLVDEADL
jgi:ATP-dependent helicase Lhr and Lhr-like helicase